MSSANKILRDFCYDLMADDEIICLDSGLPSKYFLAWTTLSTLEINWIMRPYGCLDSNHFSARIVYFSQYCFNLYWLKYCLFAGFSFQEEHFFNFPPLSHSHIYLSQCKFNYVTQSSVALLGNDVELSAQIR